MKINFSPGWRNFFFDAPYPFTLEDVHLRDDTDSQVAFLSTIIPAVARVVDLGCGTGRHAVRLAAIGYEVIGVDIAPPPAQQNFHYIRADISRIPISSHSVDALICMYSSAAYDVPLKVQLREWSRIARSGANLVLDFANRGPRVKIGTDPLPAGVGWMLSVRCRQRRYQINMALQRREISFHSLSYLEPRLNWILDSLSTTEWKLKAVYGDYNASPFTSSSKRLLVHACRL